MSSEELESQIVHAAGIAASPTAGNDPNLQSQALEFLNNLATISDKCWAPGWNVFVAGSGANARLNSSSDGSPSVVNAGSGARNSLETRVFGLTLVTNFLDQADPSSPNTAAAVPYLQEAILSYVTAEFVSGDGESGVTFIKNKLAQTLTKLLVLTYTLRQPSNLLPHLLSLVHTHPPSSPSTSVTPPPLNAYSCSLVLSTLQDLSLTLGSDASIRAAKTKEAISRDGKVKDEIRAHHAATLVGEVWNIVEECLAKVTPDGLRDGAGQRTLNAANAVDLAAQAVRVAGNYATWVDISLMVTPRTVQLLMSLLSHPHVTLRSAATDALLEIVQKGMKPRDRLELFKVLGIQNILPHLEYSTRSQGTHRNIQNLGLIGAEVDGKGAVLNGFHASAEASTTSGVEFREKVARLADGISTELGRIVDDQSTSADAAAAKLAAADMLDEHMQVVLLFLADEDDGPAEQAIPGLQYVLGSYKKLKKRATAAQQASDRIFSEKQIALLKNIMQVTLLKMRYDEDAQWTGTGAEEDDEDDDPDEDTDEEEAAFTQLRKNLQMIAASVAGADEDVFSESVQGIIFGTLSRYESGVMPTWQEMEMALYATYFFGEVLASASGQPKVGLTPSAFVEMSAGVVQTSAKRPVAKLSADVLQSMLLNTLGETIFRLTQSNVASFDHPAVQLQFFECMVRYSNFFAIRPEALQQTLEAFLGERGIHNRRKGVRRRVNYLLARLVRESKSHIPHDLIGTILSNMQDVLVINARLPEVGPNDDALLKATEKPGAFESQMHLYELGGVLLALLNLDPERQAGLLTAVAVPLSSALELAVQRFEGSGSTDLVQVLQAHHLILAMSNLAKGFPDAHSGSFVNQDGSASQWIHTFKTITGHIVAAISSLRRHYIIREAGRSAFARIVSTIGRNALPFVPTLIEAILAEVSSTELIDSLNFLGLIIHRYKNDIRDIMDSLFLGLIERIFYFLNQPITGTDDSMERAELQKAYISLISSLIQADLDAILVSEKNQGQLQTLLQSIVYYAGNASDKICQRAAVGALGNIVFKWGSTMQGFETFIYENMVPLVYETPARSDFDLSDAQSQQVVGELAGLIKKIYATRGEDLINYLVNIYFPRINCPPELAQEMAGTLKSADVKAYRKQILQFVKLSTGRS